MASVITSPVGAATALPENLARRTERSGDCLLWTSRLDRYGYARTNGQLVHRLAYEAVIGPIPDGLTVDHICHDPQVCQLGPKCPHRRCVNPFHMVLVTSAENAARAAHRVRDRCSRGHRYTKRTTYITPKGARQCRICNSAASRAYKKRRAA